ncbi:hypothetical protein LPJ73_001537 [Coemansia sp. RSA 2703]|nr:hypothetical protein LPJ73_001537 [Coemansia sp. RSA 2703]
MRSSSEVPIPAVYLDSTASLWDQYMAELDSSEFDSKIHLKRQRVSQFLRVPWSVEKLLWFGVAICFDALLHVFSILPAKFIRATVTLALSVFYDLPELIDSVFASTPVQTVLHVLPSTWNGRVLSVGRGIRRFTVRLCGRSDSDRAADSDGASSQSISRWLSPAQLFDFYRGLLLIFTCVALCRIDTAQMYHTIRAQSSLKLYFIFSALDIFDRLLSSFGHDVLDALQSTVTDPRSQRWKTGAGYFVLAQFYMLIHTLVLFYQVITLNVAVNAYSDQLLSLLISNQFVEIKSNVFKKWEKEMLFQVACADIVERFQEIVFLFIIILRNMAELSGNGMSPLFGPPTPSAATSGAMGTVVPTVQPPVSFDSATPLAFGPLIPSWVSIPLINRILTPILMVLGTEILIDWIKHAFITKLNWIRPEIYSHYIDILSRDLACSKSGVKARGIVPPTPTSRAAASALDSVSASDADEKIEKPIVGDVCESRSSIESSAANANSRVRSSSILVHAALKAIAWVHSTLLADSANDTSSNVSTERTVSDTAEGRPSVQLHSDGYGRRRGHRRVQSVTQPQIFVEQSSRVARRIGLSPMPLACLITLMLMQVSYILMQSSLRLQHNGAPAQPLPVSHDPISTLWLVGWLSAVPVLGFVLRTAAHAVRLIYAYALVVWTKLSFGNRLMQFAWNRYRDFERRSADNRGTELDTANLKQYDDSTKKLDNNTFFEVGKLIAKEGSEAEWEKQRPKWTLDNIERYSLFKSRIPGGGAGARREMSGLQTELLRSSKLTKQEPGTPPLFPEYEPTPAVEPSSEERIILKLMEEFRNEIQSSVFFLKPPPTPPDVERYSDRYHVSDDKSKSLKELKTDITLFPEELHSVLTKKRVKKSKRTEDDGEAMLAALQGVKDDDGNSDEDDDDGNDAKGNKGGEDGEELEEQEEEEDEEENDYLDAYFDNGEEDDLGDIDDDEGGGDYY